MTMAAELGTVTREKEREADSTAFSLDIFMSGPFCEDVAHSERESLISQLIFSGNTFPDSLRGNALS